MYNIQPAHKRIHKLTILPRRDHLVVFLNSRVRATLIQLLTNVSMEFVSTTRLVHLYLDTHTINRSTFNVQKYVLYK